MLWCFGACLSLQHWTKLNKPKGEPWPEKRDEHAACCLNYNQKHPQLLVTGGLNRQSHTLGDTWILCVDSGKWREVRRKCSCTVHSVMVTIHIALPCLWGAIWLCRAWVLWPACILEAYTTNAGRRGRKSVELYVLKHQLALGKYMWPAELCYSEATKNTPQAFNDMLSSAKSTLLQHWMPSSRFFHTNIPSHWQLRPLFEICRYKRTSLISKRLLEEGNSEDEEWAQNHLSNQT